MADDLIPPGNSYDAAGRLFSPFIERGSDNIPMAVNIPTTEQMRGMSVAELTNVSSRFGYVDNIENRMQVHSGFLARFNILPGDPRYAAEMENLSGNTGRSLLGHTRRLAQRHEALTAIDGKLTTNMIRIAESDDPCDECAALSGIEGTYQELVADGNMPGDRCLGGGNCLCTVMEIR